MRVRNKLNEVCVICGNKMDSHIDGIPYCKRHYLQMHRHGKILNRTIFDKNEWKIVGDYAICITYNKQGEANGIVKVDSNVVEKISKYKIYIRTHDCGKQYACICINGRKYLLHRYLLNIHLNEYTLKTTIDHINGDSLDNRLSNLRVCSQSDNMKNIRKGNKIIGVSKSSNKNNRWIARIMSNYNTINLGYYDTFEEAALARISKEFELFREFGPNKKFYYLLSYPSPIDELKKVLSDGK